MSEDKTKIRCKIGEMEVEYEGKESFLKDDLSHLLDTMSGFFKAHLNATKSTSSSIFEKRDEDPQAGQSQFDLSVNSIAARLDVKTGPDLAMAACGYLTLVKGKERCSRAEVLATMKEASSYYKTSMGSNLSAHLGRLVKINRLNETASDTYALTANERTTIENSLA